MGWTRAQRDFVNARMLQVLAEHPQMDVGKLFKVLVARDIIQNRSDCRVVVHDLFVIYKSRLVRHVGS
jgi:hypothetical protein